MHCTVLMLALMPYVYLGTRTYFLVGNCPDLIVPNAHVHHHTPKINGTYPQKAIAITFCNKGYEPVGIGGSNCVNGTWLPTTSCRGSNNMSLQNWVVNINWYFDNTNKYNF